MTDPPAPKTFSYGVRKCPECGDDFIATNPAQGFCATGHQKAFHIRNATRGKIALPLVQAWRLGKNGRTEDRAFAFSQLCALADTWNREDRTAGRRPDIIVMRKRKSNWSAADIG